MITSEIAIIILAVLLVLVIGFFGFIQGKNSGAPQGGSEQNKLKFQAYERLILLVERTRIPNLINRVQTESNNPTHYRKLLTETILQEYDHNITQQLYVSPMLWDKIMDQKNKTIYLIHRTEEEALEKGLNVIQYKQLLLARDHENGASNEMQKQIKKEFDFVQHQIKKNQ